MAQDRNYRVFPNKIEMLKFFGSYIPDLDVATSARLAPYMYVYKGKMVVERNFVLFLRSIEALAGLEIDETISAQRGGTYIIFFNKELPRPDRRGQAVKAVVAEDKASTEEVNPATDEVASEPAEVVQEEVSPAPNAELAPVSDGEQEVSKLLQAAAALNSESDKKGSKDKLAEFAAARGITLNKTKTFENMLADLKTALGQ